MQGTAERRTQIMKILCRRRNETVVNLAFELGVSERTIRRDLEVLALSEPIYTQKGRAGGIYVDESYSMQRMYMTAEELRVLQKIAEQADRKVPCNLNSEERKVLDSIITLYTKPKANKRG